MSIDSLDYRFNHSFQYVNALFKQRNDYIDYDWLVANQHFLFPDYFKIRTMGRHMFERALNYAVSNRLGRFSFSYAVMKRFVMLFYDVICPTSTDSLEWLLKRLRRPPSEMMDWTLVEFFLFMEHWLRRLIGQESMMFIPEKKDLNLTALNLLNSVDVNECVKSHFSVLLYVSCFSNWLDIIVPDFDDRKQHVFSTIHGIMNSFDAPQIDASVLDQFNRSEVILFECDNAGEVVFDLLLVMALIQQGKQVTMVAKSDSILNDITCQEILDIIHSESIFLPLKVALDNQLSVISANTFPMVGKYLPLVTDDYKSAYQVADLVWLKGQANFQTMPSLNFSLFEQKITYKKPVGVSFIAKAPIVQYCLRYSNIKKVNLGDSLMVLI